LSYALVLVQSGRASRICPAVQAAFDQNRGRLPPDLQLRALAKMLVGLCLLTGSQPAGAVGRGLEQLQEGWNELRSREGAGSSTVLYALSTFAWANYRFGDRQAAKRLLHELVAMAEGSRLAAPAGSYTRDYWFSKWITDHSQNLGYRTLALLDAEDGDLDEAIRISELARDRRLRDRIFERNWLAEELPPESREKLGALTFEIQQLDQRLALEARIVERVRLESQRTLIIASRDDAERLIGERYRIKPSQVEVPSVAQLRGMLDAGTALVSIQLSSDRWWAVVIARDGPARFVALDYQADLRVAIRAWMSLLGGIPVRAWPVEGGRLVVSYDRPASAVGRYLSRDALAAHVARAILAPLVLAAPGAHRFVIVADDELNGLPFGAMPVDGAAAIDRFEISYAPSLGTFAALCQSGDRRAWTRDLLSFAVDEVVAMDSFPADQADRHSYGDSIGLMLEYASRHPLPFASKEVEAASRNFSPIRTTLIRGPAATKATLVQASDNGSLSKYRYVHIAAHAFSFPNDPDRSMLLLSGPRSAGAAARVLTAAELANLKMGSELLVLAGCGTAVGRYEPGQGPLGFAFAALAAGNQAAVLSLWAVADDLTQRFMSVFFDRLKAGMRPSAALRATQRQFAHDPDPRINNPGTWAAFVLVGRS
jgi:CHAT domain-containing protein